MGLPEPRVCWGAERAGCLCSEYQRGGWLCLQGQEGRAGGALEGKKNPDSLGDSRKLKSGGHPKGS